MAPMVVVLGGRIADMAREWSGDAWLVALVIGLLALAAASSWLLVSSRHLNLPPGPWPLPVVGNWLQVGDDLNQRLLATLAQRYGHIFLLRMGQRNLVVVSSPELAKEVLHTQGVEFGSRTRNVVFDIFTGKGQDMVFTVYGDHWRRMRRIMTLPFFTNKVVQQNRIAWEAEVDIAMEDIKKLPGATTSGIIIRQRIQLMMYNVVYKMMFGRTFSGLDDPLYVNLMNLNNENNRLAQSFKYSYGDFLPSLKPFLRGYLKEVWEANQRRLNFLRDAFLNERKK